MSQDGVISMTGLEAEAIPANDREVGLDLTPKRSLLHRVSYPPRISLNGLLISLLCTLLLVMIGFVPVNLPSPLNIGTTVQDASQLQLMRYTFQLPLALFMAAFLGPFMGTGIMLLFLGMGLAFFPLFANGGGWHYVVEPGFGYLLGAFIAASMLGKAFHKAFQKQGSVSRSLKILTKAFAAVVLLHGVGLLYLLGLSLTGQLPLAELPGWILRLTVETAPYDFISTFVFLCLVRQLRVALSLVLY
jgi:biotin transport system substrate-specific component